MGLKDVKLYDNDYEGAIKQLEEGMKQNPDFYVLKNAAMPAALLEMGFISNEDEEKWLASSAGQTGIVNSIFIAFENFAVFAFLQFWYVGVCAAVFAPAGTGRRYAQV